MAEDRVMVACAVCTIQFDVSARLARDINAGRTEARCLLHRKQRPRPATQMAAMRRWWLNHPLPLTEVLDIACSIWQDEAPPKPHTSPAVLAMVASAAPTDGDLRAADAAATQVVARARAARQKAVQRATR